MSTRNGDIPTDKWGLAKLGKFCVERHQKVGIDVWLIGKAMCLAKALCKKEGTQFTTWKREHGFSDASASRYMRLYELYQTDDKLERLKTLGPLAAYVESGIEAARPHVARQPRGTKNDSTPPAWAVPEPEDSATAEEDSDPAIQLTPTKDCVAHELRNVVPFQVDHLREKVAFLLEQDADLIRDALPKKKCDRTRIAADIDSLVQMLSRLAATVRGDAQAGKTAA